MKILNNRHLRAFSLAEVLITLIIVSVLMIILAPSITKSMMKSKNNGVVFTYSPENNTIKDNVCFLTVPQYDIDGKGNAVISQTYAETKSCSEYEFVVPDGVNSINLTLVAGGGGGGGASGGIISEENIDLVGDGTEGLISRDFYGYLIKNIKINALVGKGTNGTGSDSISGGSGAGNGGKSSSAFIGLDIPYKIMRGANYTPNTDEEDIETSIRMNSDSAEVIITNKNNDASTVSYKVPFQNDANPNEILQPTCTIGSTVANLAYDCGATKNNYFTGELGQGADEATTAPSSGTAHLNSVVWGGDGGKIPQIPNGYGWGGKNSDYILSKCNTGANSQSCDASSTLQYTKMSSAQQAGSAYGSVTITTEAQGTPGGGGAGGSAVRIMGLNVNAGETYIIRVGKGGDGGRAGLSSKNAPDTTGLDGESGTTTAIYKRQNGAETLVYMVSGGAGGLSGNVSNLYADNAVYSGRNLNMVFTSSSSFTNVAFDENKGGRIKETITEASKLPSDSGAGAGGVLEYTFYSEVPFDYLNFLKNYAGNNLYDDKAYGGHSAFNTENKTCTPSSGQTVICGVAQKMKSNGSYLYTGGLGGFSGLGGKAGCGGYYAGNNIVKNSDATIVETNKLYTPSDLGPSVLKGSEKFSVFDLYDNCTTKSANGQSASFVSPDAIKLQFGSAGAGGGGGGYSIFQGSGSGGNGQDGYLMIDWRK